MWCASRIVSRDLHGNVPSSVIYTKNQQRGSDFGSREHQTMTLIHGIGMCIYIYIYVCVLIEGLGAITMNTCAAPSILLARMQSDPATASS